MRLEPPVRLKASIHGQTHALLSNAACAKHSAQRVQAIATDSTGVHTIAHAAALFLSALGAKAPASRLLI